MKKLFVVFWVMSFVLIGGSFQNIYAQGSVKIGVLYPFSGPLAFSGGMTFRGVEIAQEIQNEKGGLFGKKIEFVKGDGVDPKTGMGEAERLINQGIKVIIGGYSSSTAYAISEVTERHKAFYFVSTGIADPITQRGFKYLFRIMSAASQFGATGADFIAESMASGLGIDKKDLRVGFVYEDTLYGTSTGGSAVKRALENGLKVVAVETYSQKSLDLSPLVMRLKSVNPDVLFAVTYISDGQLFWRQAKEGGLNLKAFVDVGNWGDPKNAEVLGDDINQTFNVYLPTHGNPAGLLPEARKLLDEFNTRYKKKYNEDPGVDNFTGFQAGWFLLHDLLPKAKSLDPEIVRKAALTIDMPIGSTICGFGVKFAPPGDKMAGQNLRSMNAVHQWSGQKLYLVYPERFAVKKPTLPMAPWGQRK